MERAFSRERYLGILDHANDRGAVETAPIAPVLMRSTGVPL